MTKHTIGNSITYYLGTISLSDSSIASYKGLENKLRDAHLIHTEIKDVTPAIVRKFLNELKVAPSTAYYIFFLKLKAVLNHYVKDHKLGLHLDLEGLIKQPKYVEPAEGEEEYLTLREVKELSEIELSDLPRVHYARELFLMMCYSGMSVSDLINFNPEKAITKDGNWVRYRRKKNNNSCVVPLLPMFKDVIGRNKWPVKIARRTIQYQLQPLQALVGKPVTSHWGRHTFGCIMLELGFRMETVSRMMGHSSITTTERFYAKVSHDMIAREMEEIPDKLKMLWG